MRSSLYIHLAALALFAVAVGSVLAADEESNFKRVPIPTVDGVELEGTFYPAKGKDACVLLLHNFDRKEGGDSHKDGWDHLASALQKKGYPVLSFDFRGFGNSKKVNPAKFWSPMAPHNANIKAADKNKESIDKSRFPPNYYPNLVNDIAAAKAFLDHRNDSRDVNTSNLVVIGAGEGATLGALWMASQCRLQKDRRPPGLAGIGPLGPPVLDEPESKDLACAVFLNISPTVATLRMPVKAALQDIVRLGKVRTALVQGKSESAQTIAKDLYDHIVGTKGELKGMVARKDVNTKLGGSKILNDALDTESWIIDTCLDNALEKRTAVEWRRREIDKSRYYWAFPKPGLGAHLIPAKQDTDELFNFIPLNRMGLNTP
jgi:pimeloyl-ACP methyl ester carboxylesterase